LYMRRRGRRSLRRFSTGKCRSLRRNIRIE
jgi:hypothetical protein